ncbi:MAG: 6-carboxytetrahydropterin synthase QueD [Bacteroidetes bacterium]|nr:MAG: 6-carboxytetrahydropterin synthase QueD [Bacteroidota bacterium]
MFSKIAKEFKWEMSHRLPFHKGECKNIHGHSYKLRIELSGKVDDNGMLIDYYNIEKIVMPLVRKLDHAFICNEADTLMLEFLTKHNFKHYVIKENTTAENLADFFISKLSPQFKNYSNINHIIIRVYETEDAYAESESKL